MFFNPDIDNYFLDFLSISQLTTYLILAKSFFAIFKKSKYYYEFIVCREKYNILSIASICKCNCIHLLKKYMKDHNTRYEDYFYLTAINGHLETSKLFASYGINTTKNDTYLVRKIAANGHLNMIKYLIFQDISLLDDIFVTRHASNRGHLKILQYLFLQGANIRVYDSFSVKWAFGTGSVDIIKFLTYHNVTVIDHIYIFTTICKYGYLELAKFLVFHSINIRVNHYSILQIAAKHGHLDMVRFLIYQGVNNKYDLNYALEYASKHGHLEIVYFLVSMGTDMTGNDIVIQQAANNGHSHIIRFLIFHGINVMANDNFAVRYACIRGYMNIVQFLISQGADLSACDNFVIRYVSEYNHLEIVKFIILQGLDITSNNNYALKFAASKGYLEIVKFLSYHIVDAKTMDSIFNIAFDNEHKSVVNFLIYQGTIFHKLLKIDYFNYYFND